jgi:ubiquinone/menaquinone biosynthesis C-methylase UbiE
MISGLLLGMSKSEMEKRVKKIIEFAELQSFTKMKLKQYSSGMRTRLAFSVALQIDPDILLVDEILSVGDISFRQKSYDAFLSFKKSGKTILYTTHNLDVLPKICDRVMLIHHGKLIMIGKPAEVIYKYKEITKPKEEQIKQLYDIREFENLIIDSEPIPVDYRKTYRWKINIVATKIGKKSAFIAILFLSNGKEVARRIRFISDTTMTPKEYLIATVVPSQADSVVLSYRVNCDMTSPSHTIIELPPMVDCKLETIEGTSQVYDEWQTSSEIAQKKFESEKIEITIGDVASKENYLKMGKNRLRILTELGLQQDSTLLEIGCGTGILVNHLREYFATSNNYVGIDITDAIDYCKKEYPEFEFLKYNLNKLPDLSREFDMIYLSNAFLHMNPEEIMEFLSVLKQILKPSGSIVVGVIINSSLSDYTGTRSKMEFNENYFIDLAKLAGYNHITVFEKLVDNRYNVFRIAL